MQKYPSFTRKYIIQRHTFLAVLGKNYETEDHPADVKCQG